MTAADDPELNQALLSRSLDAAVPTSADPLRWRWLTARRVLLAGIVLFTAAGLLVTAGIVFVARAQQAQGVAVDRANAAADRADVAVEHLQDELDRRTAARDASDAAERRRTTLETCAVLATSVEPDAAVLRLSEQLGCPPIERTTS